MNTNKLLLSLPVFAVSFVLFATTSFADTACQPIYGGGQTCVQTGNIVINKTVQNPQTKAMVDNLGINDPKYGPESIVTFQISVKNTGNATVNNVQVKDIFPEFFVFSTGAGNYDGNSRTLSFVVNDLKADESRTFNIVGKLVPANQLPGDKGMVCVVNQALATFDGKTNQDNAQFCIEKAGKVFPQPTTVVTQPGQPGVVTQPGTTKGGLKVFPAPEAQKTPSTGPEMLALVGLLPTGLLGHFIRKKTALR